MPIHTFFLLCWWLLPSSSSFLFKSIKEKNCSNRLFSWVLSSAVLPLLQINWILVRLPTIPKRVNGWIDCPSSSSREFYYSELMLIYCNLCKMQSSYDVAVLFLQMSWNVEASFPTGSVISVVAGVPLVTKTNCHSRNWHWRWSWWCSVVQMITSLFKWNELSFTVVVVNWLIW